MAHQVVLEQVHHLSFAPQSRFVVRCGVGTGPHPLNAFDAALVDSGVGDFNLIKVSSILPPAAIRGETIPLIAGSRLPIAYGAETTTKRGRRVSAAIGIGVPEDGSTNGVIMEFHGFVPENEARDIITEMTQEAMRVRNKKYKEIIVGVAEIVCKDRPVCAFASVALVPAELY